MRLLARDKKHEILKITIAQKVEDDEEKQVYFHDQEAFP